MYYIFLRCPFLENTIVIRQLFSLSEAEAYIKAHNKEHVVSLLKNYTKEHSPLEQKYKNFYPLRESPTLEKSGNLEGFANKYILRYKKDFLSKGWVYNSVLEIETIFEYTICSYNNVINKPDPFLSKKNSSGEISLVEALHESEFFKKVYHP